MSFLFQSSSRRMSIINPLILALGVGKRDKGIMRYSNIISKCQRDIGGDKKESVSSENFQLLRGSPSFTKI